MTIYTECPRLGRWFGCKFKARYDCEGPAQVIDQHWLPTLEPSVKLAAVTARRRSTYVRDVCVRCGRTIERATEKGSI